MRLATMPHKPIMVKDILIQGTKGQFNSSLKPAAVCDLLEYHRPIATLKMDEFKRSQYILTKEGFYFYSKPDNTISQIESEQQKLNVIKRTVFKGNRIERDGSTGDTFIRAYADDLKNINEICHHSMPAKDPFAMTKQELLNSFGNGFSKVIYDDKIYRVNPAVEPSVILFEEKKAKENILEQVNDFIESIVKHAKDNCSTEAITRIITDEFSFYPEDRPFSLDEYKAIITKTSELAASLPPDVHLVLATFPVVWPDGKLRNCGLHVESPSEPELAPVIRHFSKTTPHYDDPIYMRTEGNYYQYNSQDDNKVEAFSAEHVLKDTPGLTIDMNQYQSAFKTSLKNGDDMIVSIGICLDHGNGIERGQVHELIERLKNNNIKVPIHCSHIISSHSIEETAKNKLSTISHADPNPKYRRPMATEIPGRIGYTATTIKSIFSGELDVEHYQEKQIGILHSDLFQHAISNRNQEEMTALINAKDNTGSTLLHQVFSEARNDREMIAKRLYFLIINGGDPEIENNQGKSVIDLANELDSAFPDGMISKAIHSSLQWREDIKKKNLISADDGHSVITRMASSETESTNIPELVLSGANPYQKNSHGQSAIDIIDTYANETVKAAIKEKISTNLTAIQYGYQRLVVHNILQEKDRWFYPYIPEKISDVENSEAIGKNISDLKLIINQAESIDITIGKIVSLITNIRGMIGLRNSELIYDAIRYELSHSNIDMPIRFENQQGRELTEIVISTMLSTLCEALKSKWPIFIKNTQEMHQVLSGLSQQQCSDVYQAMKPKLSAMILASKDLALIKYFAPEERTEIFRNVMPELGKILETMDDIKFIQYLLPEERSEVYQMIKPRLEQMVLKQTDLNFMQDLLPNECDEIFETIQHKLKDLLSSFYSLEFVKNISIEHRALLVDIILDKIKEDVISEEEYQLDSIIYFSDEEAKRIIENIPGKGWNNITNNQDLLGSIAEMLRNRPDNFKLILDLKGDDIVDSFKGASSKILSQTLIELAQLSGASYTALKEYMPKLIKHCHPNQLKFTQNAASLNTILSKTYLPDDIKGFEALLEKIDPVRKTAIIHAVGENFRSQFTVSSMAMTKEEFADKKQTLSQIKALHAEQDKYEFIPSEKSSSPK